MFSMNRSLSRVYSTKLLGKNCMRKGLRVMSSITTSSSLPQEESTPHKCLNPRNLNPNIFNVEYAVRGPIVDFATKLEDELNRGVKKSYQKIIKANIGDCHATGQSPITYFRQVLAACVYPELCKMPGIFPEDVTVKSLEILRNCHGSVGCYSDSEGVMLIRKKVATFIESRDGFTCSPNDIVLTNGASSAVRLIIYALMNGKDDKKSGIMVPVPQYPLYSATISENGGHLMPYYLDESNNWALNIDELERCFQEESKRCIPKAIVVINPGNPTGQVLRKSNITEIIKFAKRKNILIMADEVYQENIYDDNLQFHSFKKVIKELGDEYSNMELVSFHSVSKGYYGECGIRGGYMELLNIDPDVRDQLRKLLSCQLGSTVPGQVLFSCVVDPPQVGDESYKLYEKERNNILGNLKTKAQLVYNEMNKIEGITCNPVSGSMYAFPRLHLTKAAIEEARKRNVEPDALYCMQLLEQKGICVVPGSGFKQIPGTHHFRTTILPSVQDIRYILKELKDFNEDFRSRYPPT